MQSARRTPPSRSWTNSKSLPTPELASPWRTSGRNRRNYALQRTRRDHRGCNHCTYKQIGAAMKLEDHPTVKRIQLKTVPSVPSKKESLNAGWLKQLVLDAGADDVGFVEIGRPALDDQRQDVLKAFPHTKTLISFVVRMNRETIRTPARSVSNSEFHHSGDEVNNIARSVVRTLEDRGIRAMNPAMGFPMEMAQFPGKVWVVSHKPVAAAAGLGMMGIHRNVIHEQCGSCILLGTILLDAEVSEARQPTSYEPGLP